MYSIVPIGMLYVYRILWNTAGIYNFGLSGRSQNCTLNLHSNVSDYSKAPVYTL